MSITYAPEGIKVLMEGNEVGCIFREEGGYYEDGAGNIYTSD